MEDLELIIKQTKPMKIITRSKELECFWENGGWRRPGAEDRLQFLSWTSADDGGADDDDDDDDDDCEQVLMMVRSASMIIMNHDAVYIQYSQGNSNHSSCEHVLIMMVMFTMVMVVVSVMVFMSSPWYSRGLLQFLLVVASHILLLEIGKK